MQILNKNTLNGWPDGSIYVGRGTPFGNPFVIGEHGNRDEVIAAYGNRIDYLVNTRDPVMLTALAGLKEDAALVCSCAPLPCHAMHIVSAWEKLKETGMPHFGKSMTYAGIGSRKTPPHILSKMSRVAKRLETIGYTLRSGGANGADEAFGNGCNRKQIFLPWPGFNGHTSEFDAVEREAMNIAAAVHPVFDRLSYTAQKLMARNSYQVLGPDLRTPSDFVVCWTPDSAETESDRTQHTGGTGQAIALACRWNIPVFNLAKPDALDRLASLLENAR